MPEHFSEKHRNVEFSNNVTHTMRQEPGMYAMLAGTSESYQGSTKARIANRFGRLKMQPKTGRNTKTDTTEMSSVARWIKPGPTHTVAPIIDPDDQMEVSLDLGSPAIKEVSDAAKAYHDDKIFEGIFGNAYEGKDGDTLVPFKSTNVIAHGGTGLTLAKIKAARELIRKRNAPLMREMPIWLLHPEDETDLLSITEYVNQDYTGSRPLERGEIKPWMGFRFMPVNPDADSLPDSYDLFFEDAGLTRINPIIFPSGLHRGVWDEFSGYIDRRPDVNQSTQYWGGARSAAVRTDEDLFYLVKTQ